MDSIYDPGWDDGELVVFSPQEVFGTSKHRFIWEKMIPVIRSSLNTMIFPKNRESFLEQCFNFVTPDLLEEADEWSVQTYGKIVGNIPATVEEQRKLIELCIDSSLKISEALVEQYSNRVFDPIYVLVIVVMVFIIVIKEMSSDDWLHGGKDNNLLSYFEKASAWVDPVNLSPLMTKKRMIRLEMLIHSILVDTNIRVEKCPTIMKLMKL